MINIIYIFMMFMSTIIYTNPILALIYTILQSIPKYLHIHCMVLFLAPQRLSFRQGGMWGKS